MKIVNIFIISAPFDLLLGIRSRIMSFNIEISKNWGKSSVAHILLTEKQTTKKSKYTKHAGVGGDLIFLSVATRYPGSLYDSRVLRNTNLIQHGAILNLTFSGC